MRRFSVLVLLAGSIALGPDVFAQETPEPGSPATEAAARVPGGLEEIVVTARKKARGEQLQDIPLAISAFTGNYLEQNFVEDLTDLGRSAPNVQLSDAGTFPATANFSIRGNAIFSSIVSDEPVVGIFVDGVYVGQNVASIDDLFELEAVEILRGPQGTLFGRNVTGGAISVRTRRPSGEFGIRGRATVGSFSRSDAALSVEGPLTETFAWKLDLLSKDRNGMFDTPFQGGEQGHRRSWTFRPMFSWQPTDALDIQGIYEVIQYKADGLNLRLSRDGGPNADGCQVPPTVVVAIPGCSPLDPQFRPGGAVGNFDLQQDERGDQGFKVQRATVEANWDIGSGTLTSITGWRNVIINNSSDIDGTPVDNFQGGPGGRPTDTYQHQISSELRYATQIGDRADITAGLYYLKQDLDYREVRRLFATVAGPTGLLTPARGELDHQSAAIFAQGDYQLTDRLTLTLGTRWTWEEKVAVVHPSAVGDPLCDVNFLDCKVVNRGGSARREADQDTWDYWSRHAALRYQVNEDVLVYATYTRSFRAGGFNLRASSEFPFKPYDEERRDVYELGLKGDWLEGTLRTNLAAFYDRGTDVQRTILIGVLQDPRNAAKAHIAGVDAEIWWVPIEGLTLNTTAGWVDAEYDNFAEVCDGNQETGRCAKVFGLEMSEISPGVGRELEFAYIPEWTFGALARYEFPVPVLGGGTLALQTSVYWRDRTFGNDQNTVPVDSYTLWDASISYTSPDDRYTISVFGKNLTEDPYHDFGANIFGAILDWNPGPPRSFGVEVSFRY